MKNWKKILAVLLTGSLIFSLAACSSSTESTSETTEDAAAEEEPETEAAPDETAEVPEAEEEETAEEASKDFENWTEILTSGVVEGEDVVFDVLPDGYNDTPSEHEGTTTFVHYTTDVYEDGETHEKFARVYLPYGYDENDKETKYNVIYYQHGNAGSPNELFDHDMASIHSWNLINNLFDPDHQVMEPCIIVCPTYYLETAEDEYTTPDTPPAGDGHTEGVPANYYLEVVQDLIPAVESEFNVYCDDFSEEGIKASRDHRAWIGYSRGCMCTYNIFHDDFEYFKYWGPMSCPYSTYGNASLTEIDVYSPEELYDYLKEAIDAHPDLDFFMFGTAGGEGDAAKSVYLAEDMMNQFSYLAEQTDTFSFGLDPETNNMYFCRSEFPHNGFIAVPNSLANFQKVFFK